MAIGEAIDLMNPARASVLAGPQFDQEVLAAAPAEWLSFLEQTTVVSDRDPSARRQALEADVMADLSHFGLIEIEGPDAQKFLASLFTGDVRLVSPSLGQFTSWCDGKGRILSTFWIFMRGGAYYLLLPAELLASTLTRLKQFLLRSKAKLSDASDSLVRIGLSGVELGNRLASLIGEPAPVSRGETRVFGDSILMALGGHPRPRWLVVGNAAAVQSLWSPLQPVVLPVGAGLWSLLDILDGIPQLSSETTEEFIPQMLNLEALGGLCFTKGCYPGQEVIARLHYRGQLKRRLYLAHADSERVPSPGSKLYRMGVQESVGTVVSAARHPGEGKIALLAVVVIEQKALGEIRLESDEGPALNFVEQEIF
ncbi:MAG: folate-binding protein [Methylococcaceae bacterium]|nr:folate-binding protein [Methylococcaceae bacterium]